MPARRFTRRHNRFHHASCRRLACGAGAKRPGLVAKFAVKLDTKSAKVGEAVSAKTVKAARAKDGTELPKGSKLTGQVVAVQSNKDRNGTASLAINFD